MGRDIHIQILHEDGSYYIELPYFGRNSDWFDSITFRTEDCHYNNFPACVGIPDNCTSRQVLDDYRTPDNNTDYFDFWHMRVGDFYRWYNTVKPYETAGWVTKYDEFLIKKGLSPLHCEKYLSDLIENYGFDSEECVFLTFDNKNDLNSALIEAIDKYQIPDDYVIVYYFDC